MMRGGFIARWRPVSPLQFLMLIHLNQGPKYGYEMLKIFRDEFEEHWDLKTGTFYPALRRLEAQGFVKTEMRSGKEFYSLTDKGKKRLDQFGKRLESESNLSERYFRTVIKWMPSSFKGRIINTLQTMSRERINLYANLPNLFKDLDREKKLVALNDIRNLLRNHLNTVETLYKETLESDSS
jgi:DNA-binding PadR family transcriptional regulator